MYRQLNLATVTRGSPGRRHSECDVTSDVTSRLRLAPSSAGTHGSHSPLACPDLAHSERAAATLVDGHARRSISAVTLIRSTKLSKLMDTEFGPAGPCNIELHLIGRRRNISAHLPGYFPYKPSPINKTAEISRHTLPRFRRAFSKGKRSFYSQHVTRRNCRKCNGQSDMQISTRNKNTEP
jgi:hypothetical protein